MPERPRRCGAGAALGARRDDRLVLVDDYMVYRASGGQDFAELALAEPVSCAARGIRRTPLSLR